MKHIILYIVYCLSPIVSFAQQENKCFDMLRKMFDKINFIAHPMKGKEMFYYEAENEVQYHNQNPEDYPDEKYSFSYRLSNDASILLSDEADIYSSSKVTIRIYKEEKLIFIYDVPRDSMLRRDLRTMVETNEYLLSSMHESTCKELRDSLLYFESGPDEKTGVIAKNLTLNAKTFYMHNFTVRAKDERGIEKTTRTTYNIIGVQKKDKLMSEDFLKLVLDHKKESTQTYKDFKITDLRKKI